MIKNKKNILIIFILLFFSQKGFSSETLPLESQKCEITKNNSDKIIKNSNTYFALGWGIPGFPSFQFGYRSQNANNGMNISIQAGCFIIFSAHLKADILYLYFPKPNLKREIYFGAGLGYLAITNLVCFGSGQHIYSSISPEFLCGVQYKIKNGGNRFFQGQISWPNIWLGQRTKIDIIIPQISISYGWMF